jgi:hypothetical protein
MDDIVSQVKNDIESYLMEDMENQNKVIDFILYNPETKETQVLASDGLEDIILFAPFTKEQENGYMKVPEWDFNFDEYFFKELQNGYEIGFINDDSNYGLWNTINDLYPEDIDNKDGVQKYLQYCKDNNITRDYLDNVMKMSVPDIMQHYEYPNGIVEINGNNVSMSKETLDKQSETSYITFVLGYDLLNKELQNSNYPECDLSYDFCNSLASKFLESKEYHNNKYSTYEMLQEWIDNNKNLVNEYLGNDESKNFTRQLDNDIFVIDVGYRREQPIALVQRGKGNDKEYVVAFNYRIKDEKMDWAYGYYYDKDLNKAKEDFNKVINGGNLYKTFERKEER